MRWLITIFCLLFATGLQAQSYTVTENNCRVYFSNALDREAFWVDQLLWRHVGSNPDQLQIFDGISAITIQDANLVNYPTTDSLITQMETWIVECDTAGQAPPVPPAPSALFANARSIDLDGFNEFVSVADDASLDFTTSTPFTISAWVWMSTSGDYQIVNKIAGSTAAGYRLWIFGGDIRFQIQTNNTNYIIAEYEDVVPYDEWVHLTGYWDGSTCEIFMNGYLATTSKFTAGTVTTITNDIDLNVGAYNASADRIFDGKIDQVCVFSNIALTLPEIKELMTIRDVTQHSRYDSLVLYHEYDRPDSTQANGIVDLSPAGNNGTMQNGEYADLTECIEWPYPYQLDISATVANLTPMQSDSNVSFGGFAIDYDGSAEYTEVGDNPGLSFTNDSMYISAWIQLDDATNAPIINKPSEYLFWSNASDQLEVRYIDASTGGYIGRIYSTALTIYEGQYIYVEAILNGNTSADIDLRVNGSVVDDTDANSGSYTAMEDQTNDFFIGYDGVNYAGGRIGDVVLSGDLLTSQYNAHAPVDMTTTGDVLAAYWRGYNSTNVASGVLDQSGNGLNGTPTNTDLADFQYTTPREIFDADTAGSVDFDGLSDYISIADSDSLNMTTQAGTNDTSVLVSMWVKADDWTSFVLATFDQTNNRTIQMSTNSSDDMLFAIYDTDGDYIGRRYGTAAGLMTQYENEWIHLAFLYDGGETVNDCFIYINSVAVHDANYFSGTYNGLVDADNALNIGTNTGVSIFQSGQIAHFTIMKGLNITNNSDGLCKIQEIYNDGSPVDPRNWTFWNDNFIHYKLDQSEDLEATEGVTNISPNGSCNGTGQSMTNAANKITTSYPTN